MIHGTNGKSSGARISTSRDSTWKQVKPLLGMVSASWKRFLSTDAREHEIDILKKHE
jgi:hypothetical protein